MIAEHCHDWQVDRFLEHACQAIGLLRSTVIGEVSTQDDDVGIRCCGSKNRRIGVRPVPAEMQIGQGDKADGRGRRAGGRGIGQLDFLPGKK